ncbi:MAG: PAAR domain-containing protein, partial [Alphaproteobacteria bacterium]|nr:PAAR domain-containing protein [Alphaproteobacteria bacterium]
MPPAARLTDMHTCPMVTPGIPPVPHVGGPIIPACDPTVLIGFLPAARVGDMCTCVGPPDTIVKGSPTVRIGYMPAARIGDLTAHGGVIVAGCPTVLIGDMGGGAGAPSVAAPAVGAPAVGAPAAADPLAEPPSPSKDRRDPEYRKKLEDAEKE